MENLKKGIERKNIIREAAFRLFLTEDYEAVSLKDIENITKMTRGCTLYHYPSKKDIFVDVIDVYILDTQRNKYLFEDVCDISLFEYLNNYIDNIFHVMEKLGQFVISGSNINGTRAYMGLILQAEKYYPGFHQLLNEIEKNEILKLKQVILKAQENGEIKQGCNAELLAQQIRLLFLGKSFYDALKKGLNIYELKEQLYFLYFLVK